MDQKVGTAKRGQVTGAGQIAADAVPGLDSEVAADALIAAFTEHYRCWLRSDTWWVRWWRPGRMGSSTGRCRG